MRELLRQGERFTSSLQCLIRVAQEPQSPGRMRDTDHSRILAKGEGERTLLPVIIETEPPIQVIECGSKVPKVKLANS
jgi:hypothetical protein